MRKGTVSCKTQSFAVFQAVTTPRPQEPQEDKTRCTLHLVSSNGVSTKNCVGMQIICYYPHYLLTPQFYSFFILVCYFFRLESKQWIWEVSNSTTDQQSCWGVWSLSSTIQGYWFLMAILIVIAFFTTQDNKLNWNVMATSPLLNVSACMTISQWLLDHELAIQDYL